MADKGDNNYSISVLNPDPPEAFLSPADKKSISKKIQHFENLISEFSTVLIDTPEEYLENELSAWLKKFVEFLNVDRCVVNEYQDDKKVIHLLLDYTVPEVDLRPLVQNYTPSEEVLRELKKGDIIKVENIPEGLPQAFRGGLIERDKTKSIIIFPLSVGYKIFGSMVFSSFRKRCNWSDDLVRRMKLIGEIIANTILRIRSYNALITEMEHRQMLENRYSSILKNASVGFMITDFSDSSIIDVNDEYCRMSGYSRDELLSKKIWEIDASGNPEKVMQDRNNMMEQSGVNHFETSHIRKDGSMLEVAVSANIFVKEGAVCCFIRDVSDLKKAQGELEERLEFEELVSEFSAELINIAPDSIFDELESWLEKFTDFLDVERGVVNEYVNDQQKVHRLMQYNVPGLDLPIEKIRETPEGVIAELEKGVIKAEKIPEDLPQAFRGPIVEKNKTRSLIVVPLSTGKKVFGNLMFSSYKKECKWSDELVRRIKLIGEIMGTAILRMRSHEALIEEMKRRKMIEERYTLVLENANVGFMISDYERNILDVNDEYCRMSGYSRDELLAMNIMDLQVPLDERERIRIIKELEGASATHHEATHIKKDGSLMELDISSTVLNENIFFSFMRDITELSKARKERDERLQFEELVSEFSAALINIPPDDIKNELEKGLEKLVYLLEMDRAVINEYLDNQQNVQVIMRYTVPGIESLAANKRETPKGIIEYLEKGQVVVAEKIPDDLPQSLRGRFIERLNTKSLVVVPLLTGNKVFGNLVIVSQTKERKWPDDLVMRIKLVGEIIGNAILRMRSHETLVKEMGHRQSLEKRYSSIIKTANVGFWISDSNAVILEANDAYCEMSGYSHEELTGMRIDEIDASFDYEKAKVAETVENPKEKTFRHERRHIRKDGSIFDVEVSSSRLEKEGIVFSFLRDVTELNKARKELEERLKFEELISEFSAALINMKIKDIESELDTWLERFANILNVDRWGVGEYSDNYNYLTYLYTYSNPNLDPLPPPFVLTPIPSKYGLEKYLQKGKYIKFDSPDDFFPYEIKSWRQLVINDGTKSIILLPLMAGDVLLGHMVIACMARERKWTQDLIRRFNLVAEIISNAFMREKTDSELDNYRKHLEKMVDERTAELKKAQRELVLSEKMATLGRLTATVSHELRNPLGTIRSSVFSVQRRLTHGDEKVMNALGRAERNIKRCDLIIDELLNYSRVRDLILELTPIDEWIEGVLDETGPPDGIYIAKELNSGATINMDRERFRRCMVNILTNAYQAIQEKHVDEPGYVRIKTHQDINHLFIEISDNGVGFDVEDKIKLFEPLYSTKIYGVGLGIPITRQIIEQHGWTMDITGEPQRGASVIITIPL